MRNEFKACTSCVHHERRWLRHFCAHPEALNAVTGKADKPCWVSRAWDVNCGLEGRWWDGDWPPPVDEAGSVWYSSALERWYVYGDGRWRRCKWK